MTKKGRWWWVKKGQHISTLQANPVIYVIEISKTKKASKRDYLCPGQFEKITGLKLKPGEVRKVRLEWEE